MISMILLSLSLDIKPFPIMDGKVLRPPQIGNSDSLQVQISSPHPDEHAKSLCTHLPSFLQKNSSRSQPRAVSPQLSSSSPFRQSVCPSHWRLLWKQLPSLHSKPFSCRQEQPSSSRPFAQSKSPSQTYESGTHFPSPQENWPSKHTKEICQVMSEVTN